VRRILLLGRNGQVGWELQRSLAPLAEVVALERNPVASGGSQVADLSDLSGDLCNPEALTETVRVVRPDIVVNAAAYTAVDKAEAEPDTAEAINAVAPGVLARTCAEVNAWLIHYSTDYVFDGSGDKPWREEDRPAPLNVYGRSKLEGEARIRASGCRHLIFRTSWVYAARGSNFPKTILRLAGERDALKVIDDQVGAPTGADLLADITAHAVRAVAGNETLGGTYHVAAAGTTTWFDYASFVIAQARESGFPVTIAPAGIAPVASSEYPTPAQRPRNSRLDCRKLEQTFGLRLPPWQHGVARLVAELAPDRKETIK